MEAGDTGSDWNLLLHVWNPALPTPATPWENLAHGESLSLGVMGCGFFLNNLSFS